MNKSFRNFAILFTIAAAFVPAYADRIARPYDWTVELETRRMPHMFEYEHSRLHGVEKIQASYQHTPTAADPDPTKTQYEYFWYHDGKPLGLDRKHDFDVSQGDGVSIHVKHKEGGGTEEECKAAANAILRVILDAYLNKNAVVNVRVPPESFDRIRDALIDQGCLEHLPAGDATFSSSINIFMQTEPDAERTDTLYYI